jgi:HD-GYP domain-containing protein (c-di-GMP phosphodiesterase class II)
MEKSKMQKRDYSDINRISAKCMRIVIYFLIVFYAFIVVRDEYDILLCSITFGICALIALVPSIFVNLFKLDHHPITKHVILISTVCISGVLLTELNVLAYPLVLFPILLASLYYNRTFVLYTSLLVCVSVFASAVFQVECSALVLAAKFTDYTDIFLDMAVPIILVVVFMSFIAFFIVDRNAMMMNKNLETATTMMNNQKGLIYAFAEISESKSKFTGEHIKRVAEYMKILAQASGFDEEYVDKLATASMMHDIGKLMISEEILDKPSKLTDEEYQIMKNHVLYGDALLEKCPGEMLHLARILAKEHHERWDGSGYLGMKGEEISYIARLIAVCDVFDALTSDRYYKKGWSLQDTYDEIVRLSGTHFDPKVVRLFIKNFDKFKEVHDSIPDKQIY